MVNLFLGRDVLCLYRSNTQLQIEGSKGDKEYK